MTNPPNKGSMKAVAVTTYKLTRMSANGGPRIPTKYFVTARPYRFKRSGAELTEHGTIMITPARLGRMVADFMADESFFSLEFWNRAECTPDYPA